MPYQKFADPNTSFLFEAGAENVGSGARAAYDAAVAGANMYYNEGFLPAGGGQMNNIYDVSGILGGIAQVAAPIISAFQRPTFGQLPPASTVPTVSGQVPVMTAHPVIGAAGGAVAPVMGPTMAQGGHGRYYPPGTKGTHQVRKGPHAGSWVKNRHRNVCNPKALRRAISRTHGFARLAMKTIHLVHPKKHARFGGFRKRRARR